MSGIGFQILVDEGATSNQTKASLQVHQDVNGEHYYGGMAFVQAVQIPVQLGARHQLVYALLDIVDQVMAVTNEQFDEYMKIVERPF